MVRPILLLSALLTLAACGKEDSKPAQPADGGGPQVATSIDDLALPVDRSDQITAIDAATGDASGMPRDGGAVVNAPKPKPGETAAEPAPATPAAAVATPPAVAAPAISTEEPTGIH